MKLLRAMLCMTLLTSLTGLAAGKAREPLNAHRQQGSCEFSHKQFVKLANDRPSYLLTVKSFGRECRSANIMADISYPPGRSVWREALRLTTFEDVDTPHISTVHVRRIVQTWASVENTGEAPPWTRQNVRPKAAGDPTIYLTTLARADYERIRKAREPMICVPIGPETGHCLAALPRLNKVTVFIMRGV